MAGVRRRSLIEEELRNTAATVFARQGIDRTSLSDIAEAIGSGRTSIYTYYASKDDLLAAIIDECAAEGRAVLSSAVKVDVPTAGEKLRLLVRGLLAYVLDRPDRIRVLNAAIDLSAPADRRARALNRQFFTHVRAVVEQGMRDGEFRRGDAGVAAHIIIGAIRSVPWWYRDTGPLAAHDIIDQLSDQLVRSVVADHDHLISAATRQAVADIRAGLDRLESAL